jgi:hypothetical protein
MTHGKVRRILSGSMPLNAVTTALAEVERWNPGMKEMENLNAPG